MSLGFLKQERGLGYLRLNIINTLKAACNHRNRIQEIVILQHSDLHYFQKHMVNSIFDYIPIHEFYLLEP